MIVRVLESFVNQDANVQERIASYFESRSMEKELYQELFEVALTSGLRDSLRLAAVIQIRNMYLRYRDNSPVIESLFIEALERMDETVLMGFDFLAETVLDSSDHDWWTVCLELSQRSKIGFIVLLVVLSASKSEHIVMFLPLLLQTLSTLTDLYAIRIVVKTLCKASRMNRIPDVLIGQVCEHAIRLACVPEFTGKAIRIYQAILRDSRQPLETTQTFLQSVLPKICHPKIAIRIFDLIKTMTENEATAELIVRNAEEFIRGMYFPFFAVAQSNEMSPQDFVCENDFDAFGARDNPKAAAFRSLEAIAGIRPEFVELISLFWSDQTTSEDAYAKTHMLVTAIAHLRGDVLECVIAKTIEWIQSTIPLVQCSGLLLLRYLKLRDEAILYRCIELLKESTYTSYFAAVALCRVLSYVPLSDEQVMIIVERTVFIAEQFGAPEILEIITQLYEKGLRLDSMLRVTPPLVASAFGLIDMYMQIESPHTCVCPSFHLLLIMMYSYSGYPDQEQALCQQVSVSGIGLLSQAVSDDKTNFILPLLEILCNAVFYAPEPLQGIWSLFDIIIPALGKLEELAIDTSMALFSNIALKETDQTFKTALPTIYTVVENNLQMTEYSQFLASVLRIFPEFDNLYSNAVAQIMTLAESDDLSYVEDCFPVLIAILLNRPELFQQIVTANSMFLDDFLACCGPRELDILEEFVPSDILAFHRSQCDDNNSNTPSPLDIRRVPLF